MSHECLSLVIHGAKGNLGIPARIGTLLASGQYFMTCLVKWCPSRALVRQMIVSLQDLLRRTGSVTALLLAVALFSPCAQGADKNKKEEKEKKEKIEPWVEVRTAHFIAASDGGEKTARQYAAEFEQLLRVFQSTLPNCRVSNGIPVRLLVARDGPSFGRMIPEFRFDKRHDREQPPGVFVAGSEKTFIGLRANAPGRFRFEEIYSAYAHEVLKLSYGNLPPWLEVGFASVFGSLTFTDRGARLERPDPEDLSILTESPLLPLDILIKADRNSGYFTSGDKNTVYYAESRILVHYLVSEAQSSGAKSLSQYVAAVQGGADQFQAARTAFGDLGQLQAKLQAFINELHGAGVDIPTSGGGESGGAARTLTAAETEARMGDFLANRGRDDDARDKLEEAIQSQPSLAEAEQALGFLQLKKNELDEAQKHLERAAQLDAKDSLNYYGLGGIAVIRGRNGGPSVGAAEAFEKAVALEPNFAPAWFGLAQIYSDRNETLEKALADIQRAASLAPGDSEYQLGVAALLSRLGRTDEARKTATGVQESASDRDTERKAGDLLARMTKPQPSSAPGAASGPMGPPPAEPRDTQPKIERKTEPVQPASIPVTTAEATTMPTAPSEASVPPLFSETRTYSMLGTITEVNCTSSPQVQLTLKSLTILMKLHAEDLAKVLIKIPGSESPAKNVSCASLRGRSVRVSYSLVLDKAWDGEMQSVELRNQP
jgi:tetratricopeptide (TPR) repeat protein